MNPDFIYFKEIALDDNNKFVLDFSDEEFIQKINFNKNFNYYIASLDCNLILKEYIKKDKKKEIEELSQKSRLLLEKGAAYQNDIGYLISNSPSIFNFPEFVGLTYHFILYLNSLNDNCFSYKFFDTVEKKIRDCRIYSRFSHFKNNGFEFQRIIPPQGKENVSIRLFENNKKIQTVFTHDYKKSWYVSNLNFRDINSLFYMMNKIEKGMEQVHFYLLR